MIKTPAKGFTVIELVVVITVIAILATVVIVGWGAWRENTAKTVVENDLNGVVASLQSASIWQDGLSSLTPGAEIPDTLMEASDDVTLTYYGGTATAYCIDAESKVETSIKRYVKVIDKKETRGDGTCASVIGTPPTPTVTSVVSGTSVVFSWTVTGDTEGVTAETSLNGSAWTPVALRGTIAAGDGYAQMQSLRVRTKNAFGGVSATVTKSATTASVPTASAQTVKGGPSTNPACTTGCYSYAVTTSNFPAGSYAVTCYDAYGTLGPSQTVSIPASGTTTLECFSGNPGSHYVKIGSWGNATAVYW